MIDAMGVYGLSFDILIAVPPCMERRARRRHTRFIDFPCVHIFFRTRGKKGGRPTLVFSRPLLTNCMFPSCFFLFFSPGPFGGLGLLDSCLFIRAGEMRWKAKSEQREVARGFLDQGGKGFRGGGGGQSKWVRWVGGSPPRFESFLYLTFVRGHLLRGFFLVGGPAWVCIYVWGIAAHVYDGIYSFFFLSLES